MVKTSVLAFVFLALGASTASADQESRWYVGGAVGANWVNDFSINRTLLIGGAPVTVLPVDAEMKTAAAFFGVVGYRLTDAWSIQGELSYRSNKSDSIVSAGVPVIPNEARLKSGSLMANAIYTVQGLGAVRPYVGLGIGAVNLKLEYQNTAGSADDSGWAFAYQGLVGAEVSLSRQWVLYGQYQYFRTSDPGLTATIPGGPIDLAYPLDSSYINQSLSVGVRYNF